MEQVEYITVEKCAVCSIPSAKYCSNCHKVYYCSPEHQKSHRKAHKKACYPAILRTDQIQGRHFVSTKNLAPGELVFNDEAVVCGPSGAEPYLHQICLGCYKVVQNGSTCSKCGWPVCNETCENMSSHSTYECPIFSKNGIKFEDVILSPICHDLIKYLRTCLYKEKDPSGWELHLSKLESHIEQRMANPAASYTVSKTWEFIHDTCRQEQFDFDLVNFIVGIWCVNSFGANPPSGANPTGKVASLLFPKTSLASHSCLPNTRGILLEKMEAAASTSTTSYIGFTMKLISSLPIPSGSSICITYANIEEGTYDRQQVLNEHYFFSCQCSRCLDPTELGTFYSGVKCISCEGGYVLPNVGKTNNNILSWTCRSGGNKCKISDVQIWLLNYEELIFKIKVALNEILDLASNRMDSKLETILKLEQLLQENCHAVLHSNHWLIIEIEQQLVQYLVVHTLANVGERNLTDRLIELSQHCLAVANLVQPGFNSYRGKLLYCLIEGKLNQLVLDGQTSKNADQAIKLEQLQKIAKEAEEAYSILSVEPSSSEYGRISIKLKSRISQIKLMSQSLVKQNKLGRA